jgi:hypothetical protein
MTGMLAGPDCAIAVLFSVIAVLRAHAAGPSFIASEVDAPATTGTAWALLLLFIVVVNAGTLAAETLWQRTVERAWNAACSRRRWQHLQRTPIQL